MNLSELQHLSKLAGLEFNEKELSEFKNEFDMILEHIGNIELVNIDDMEPLYHLNVTQYLRDDTEGSLSNNEFLSENSPNMKGNLIEFKSK